MAENTEKTVDTVEAEAKPSYEEVVAENEKLRAENEKLVKAINKALDMIGRNYAQSVATELLKD